MSSEPLSTSANSPSQGSSWKSRLSEKQLRKRRHTDRQSHRIARNNTKERIAELEERLQLLATPDRLVMSLLEQNRMLRTQKENLEASLDTFFSAFGFSKIEGRSAMACVERGETSTRASASVHMEDAAEISRSPLNSLPEITSPIDSECNLRMRLASEPSPFTEISHFLGQSGYTLDFTDNQMLAAISEWQPTTNRGKPVSIFKLACSMLHINRYPSQIQDHATLTRQVRSPDFFSRILHDLLPPSSWNTATTEFHGDVFLDVICKKRREMIAIATEAVRGWATESYVERLVMFWAIYTLLSILIFPTPQNLARCPPWIRPLPAQFAHSHPPWVDFLPWPLLRNRLVHFYGDFQETNLASTLLASTHVDAKWRTWPRPLITTNKTQTDLVLDPEFQTHIFALENIQVDSQFMRSFPEAFTFAVSVNEKSSTPSVEVIRAETEVIVTNMGAWEYSQGSSHLASNLDTNIGACAWGQKELEINRGSAMNGHDQEIGTGYICKTREFDLGEGMPLMDNAAFALL
ncbi:hypothetical protein EDB81DRAFT_795780, partial [Dactylonectria macrodidyma]